MEELEQQECPSHLESSGKPLLSWGQSPSTHLFHIEQMGLIPMLVLLHSDQEPKEGTMLPGLVRVYLTSFRIASKVPSSDGQRFTQALLQVDGKYWKMSTLPKTSRVSSSTSEDGALVQLCRFASCAIGLSAQGAVSQAVSTKRSVD